VRQEDCPRVGLGMAAGRGDGGELDWEYLQTYDAVGLPPTTLPRGKEGGCRVYVR